MGQTLRVSPNSSRRSARGFTVMELIVVLSIIAIVTATAVPAMREFNVRSTVSTNANDVVTALSMARAEAVKRGRNVTVIRNGGSWTEGWTIQTAAGEVLARHDPVTANYRVLGFASGSSAVQDRVAFNATGGPVLPTTGYEFSVCRPTFSPGNPQSRRVVVAGTGMIRTFRNTTSSLAGTC